VLRISYSFMSEHMPIRSLLLFYYVVLFCSRLTSSAPRSAT